MKEKEIYNLSLRAMEEETNRFRAIDQKASYYLIALTITLPLSWSEFQTVMAEAAATRCGGLALGAIVVGQLVSIVAAAAGLFCVIRCLSQRDTYRISIRDDIIEYFKKNQLDNAYLGMAKTLAKAREDNIKMTNEKASWLRRADYAICVWLVASIVVLIATAIITMLSHSAVN